MAAETYETTFAEESGMVAMVDGVRVFVGTVGSDVVTFTSLAYVAIDDNLAIDCYGDMVAHGTYFLGVPSAKFAE